MDMPDQGVTLNARIQYKKDTDANWTSNNPVLLKNELIIVEIKNGDCRFKIGDGVHAYSDLLFLDSSLRDDITAAQAAAERAEALVYSGAGAHNSVYRGKNLGSNVTAEQYAAIAAGTFDDLYIGDYWTIGGVTYRIAAFDYYLQTGNTPCTDHHAVIVPDDDLYNASMNATATTSGAYAGSQMRSSGLDQAKSRIVAAFGEIHVLSHRQVLQNAVTDGFPSGVSWYDSQVELMTEQNVYGSRMFGAASNGSSIIPTLYTFDKTQYPLFFFRPDILAGRIFWLRDVASQTNFACVNETGYPSADSAVNSLGVHPAFSIIG